MDGHWLALLIFSLRICDVSIGTIRVIYTIQGRKFIAATLGLFEAGLFITAVSSVLAIEAPLAWKIAGYSCGFAAGTLVGMTLESKIATGWVLVRVMSREHALDIADALRARDFGVTLMPGQGLEGPTHLLFIVARRRRGGALLKTVEGVDPHAFITIESVHEAIGGYLPHGAAAAGASKAQRPTSILTGGPPIRSQ